MEEIENKVASSSGGSQSDGFDFSNTCMLVSDSNEISKQLDSKQLAYDTLTNLAQDSLFKKYLYMSKYLTENQYDAYRVMLEDRHRALNALVNALPNPTTHNPKLRVVDGQVILLEASSIPPKKTPQQHIYDNWDITSEYQILPIPDCMLRGILDITAGNNLGHGIDLVAQNQGNERVNLKEENVPPHMHHSAVTTGSGFTTLTKDTSTEKSYFIKGNTVYDMFYNDSMDIGLSKNELDGTVDSFNVDNQGKNEGNDTTGKLVSHDNMPKYQSFYGFVVKKLTVTSS